MRGLRGVVKRMLIRCGRGASYSLALLNGCLDMGKWIKENRCDKIFPGRYAMYDHLNNTLIEGGPVDYLEFGVYRGESIKYWAGLNTHKGSRFFGFDTFTGFPEDWEGFLSRAPRGSFDAGGEAPSIEDRRVCFVKGSFQSSLPGFLDGFLPVSRLIINCDSDTYGSTLYVLSRLERLMKPGTIVIFDEFSLVAHEFRALRDFEKAFGRKYRLLARTEPFYEQVAIEFL